MTKALLFVISVLIVVGALLTIYALTERQEAPPPGPAALSKAEIMPELRPLIEPLRQQLAAPQSDPTGGFAPELRDQVVAAVREAQLKYSGTTAGQEALKDLAVEVSAIAVGARDKERWWLVQACIDVYEVLGLTSLSMQRLDEKAELMIAMPKVRVMGIVDDPSKGETYVLMRLIDRQTRQYESRYARIGEEVDSLKVLEIVGNNKAVRFGYTKIPGLEFLVDIFR